MNKTIGAVGWIDLTIENAADIRDFYRDVVGWSSQDVDMGDYQDYCMVSPENGEVQTGICHSRGMNTGIPSAWMMYINVADLEKSMAACQSAGGKILDGPRQMGESGKYCFIKDPAGAVCALFEHLK